MSTEILYKVSCHACGNHIAFPTEYLDQTIPCPHCGEKTLLSPPVLEPEPSRSSPLHVPETRASRKGAWMMGLLLLLVVGSWFGFVYFRLRSQVELASLKLVPAEYPEYLAMASVVNHSSRDLKKIVLTVQFQDSQQMTLGQKKSFIENLPGGQSSSLSLPAPEGAWDAKLISIRILPKVSAWFQWPGTHAP